MSLSAVVLVSMEMQKKIKIRRALFKFICLFNQLLCVIVSVVWGHFHAICPWF